MKPTILQVKKEKGQKLAGDWLIAEMDETGVRKKVRRRDEKVDGMEDYTILHYGIWGGVVRNRHGIVLEPLKPRLQEPKLGQKSRIPPLSEEEFSPFMDHFEEETIFSTDRLWAYAKINSREQW